SAGLVLVFLMTRAAPRPTLFPYTTLFRSQHPAHRVVRPVRRQHPVRHVGQGEREEQRPSRLGQATRGHAAPDVALHDPRHAAVPHSQRGPCHRPQQAVRRPDDPPHPVSGDVHRSDRVGQLIARGAKDSVHPQLDNAGVGPRLLHWPSLPAQIVTALLILPRRARPRVLVGAIVTASLPPAQRGGLPREALNRLGYRRGPWDDSWSSKDSTAPESEPWPTAWNRNWGAAGAASPALPSPATRRTCTPNSSPKRCTASTATSAARCTAWPSCTRSTAAARSRTCGARSNPATSSSSTATSPPTPPTVPPACTRAPTANSSSGCGSW